MLVPAQSKSESSLHLFLRVYLPPISADSLINYLSLDRNYPVRKVHDNKLTHFIHPTDPI
jgi:hypothetical protein